MLVERGAHRCVGVVALRDVREADAAHFGEESGTELKDFHDGQPYCRYSVDFFVDVLIVCSLGARVSGGAAEWPLIFVEQG